MGVIGVVLSVFGVVSLAAAAWFVHPALSLAVVGAFSLLAGLLLDFGDDQ